MLFLCLYESEKFRLNFWSHKLYIQKSLNTKSKFINLYFHTSNIYKMLTLKVSSLTRRCIFYINVLFQVNFCKYILDNTKNLISLIAKLTSKSSRANQIKISFLKLIN